MPRRVAPERRHAPKIIVRKPRERSSFVEGSGTDCAGAPVGYENADAAVKDVPRGLPLLSTTSIPVIDTVCEYEAKASHQSPTTISELQSPRTCRVSCRGTVEPV